MPTIPRYEREVTIPGTSGGVMPNPEAAAAPYAAVTRAGAQTAKLGEELMDVAARLERQREDAMLTEAGAKINDEYLTFMTNFQNTNKGKDAFGSMDKAAEFTRSITEKYLSGDEARQRYRNLVQGHIAAQDHLLKNTLAAYEAQQLKDYNADVRKLDLNSSLKIAQAGDYNTAAMKREATLATQKANGSLSQNDYDIERTTGISAIGVAYIMALKQNDPVSANVAFETLKPTLTAEAVQQLEPVLSAGVRRQRGDRIGTEIFKTDTTGSLEKMTDAVWARNLDPDTEQHAVTQIRERFAEREADRKATQDKALDGLSTVLLNKTKNSRGYILPSHLSGPEWDAYKLADPKGALQIRNTAESNVRTLSIQGEQDRMTALQLQKMEQDANADSILRGDDFPTRNLRSDYVSGEIGISQFQTLSKIQEQMDPLKHDAVKRALDKIETGTALPESLGGLINKDEVAKWRLKYTDLVKDFAVKNINDQDFEKKLNDLMEKNILSEMVSSWFALDSTDRQRKFQEAQKAAGITGRQTKGKTLDSLTAASILQEAKGDKNQARKIARQRGYTF